MSLRVTTSPSVHSSERPQQGKREENPRTVPSSFDSSLSLARRTTPHYVPTKPQLAAPYSPMQLISHIDQMEVLGGRLLSLYSRELDKAHAELNALSIEQALKIKENAERADKKGWSLLRKIATCFLAAVSTVLGFALIASGAGTLIGGLMIASGILSLFNFVMSECEGWEWVAKKLAPENEELQKKLSFILPTAIGALTIVLGLAGGAGSLFWASLDGAKKIAAIAQTAAHFATGISAIGNGFHESKTSRIEAQISDLKKRIFLLENFSQVEMARMQRFVEDQAESVKLAAQILRLTQEGNLLPFQST